jgi:hypothetical protein
MIIFFMTTRTKIRINKADAFYIGINFIVVIFEISSFHYASFSSK